MPVTLLDAVVPTLEDAGLAKIAEQALQAAGSPGNSLQAGIQQPNQTTVTLELPPLVTKLLLNILHQTAAGNAVRLLPVEAELTTQQAADLLSVSRPFLVGLVDKGELPARMVGTQRRLPLKDVLEYKRQRFVRRNQVLDELAAYDRELGLM